MAHQARSNVPSRWEDYERGLSPRQGSVGSETSHVHFDGGSQAAVADHLEIPRSNGNNDDMEEGSHPRRYARNLIGEASTWQSVKIQSNE